MGFGVGDGGQMDLISVKTIPYTRADLMLEEDMRGFDLGGLHPADLIMEDDIRT